MCPDSGVALLLVICDIEKVICCWESPCPPVCVGMGHGGKADCDDVYKKLCTWHVLGKGFPHLGLLIFFLQYTWKEKG